MSSYPGSGLKDFSPRHEYEAEHDLIYYETLSSIREYANGPLTPEAILSFFRTRGRRQETRAEFEAWLERKS